MYLDVFTLAALVDELMDTIVGGRVQDVLDVDETGVGLEIYAHHKRHYLYISADPSTPRIHLVDERLRRGLPKPTPLGLLLRRNIEGSLLTHVSQPPWERIVQLDFEGAEGAFALIVEPMERRSNVLLVRDGIVLDCMRRVHPSENRVRVSLPGHPYSPPPPQSGKLDPSQVTLEVVTDMLAEPQDPKRKLHQALTGRFLGFSPLLAREAAFRAGGSAEVRPADVAGSDVYAAIQSLVMPLLRREWEPGIVERGGAVEAYSVYPVRALAGWHRSTSVSDALCAYYGGAVGPDAYNAAKEPVRAALREAEAKLKARLASLQRSMTDDTEREVMRQSGELILAYQYALAPGQTELRAQYDPDRAELVIPLDPQLTPLENAQHYFERYNKAKRALDDVPELIAQTERELALLAQLAVDLDLASSWPDIDDVQQALQAAGYWRGERRRVAGGQRSAPLRVTTPDGWVIWIGRNSRQNEQVTFEKGSPGDLWLHVRDAPGAHVIIKTEGRGVPEAVIDLAASLAAFYSARRSDAKAPVDVTQRVHVRKIRGAAPGMVTYRNETTRMAEPRGAQDSTHDRKDAEK